MKKLSFLFFLAVPLILLSWCGAKPQIQPVQNLTQLQTEITRISSALSSGTITPDDAQTLFGQLQTKYTELTQTQLLSRMNDLQQIINQKKDATIKLGELPRWAEALDVKLPIGMSLDKKLSTITFVGKEWYDSFLYIYTGPYDYSMEEAVRIASWAHLSISPEFVQAKQLLNEWANVTGIDTQNFNKGIVYTNYGLTDTKIDYLISVDVEWDGKLTIEAINYKQMKK